jgi:hypothetical protein
MWVKSLKTAAIKNVKALKFSKIFCKFKRQINNQLNL